MTPQMIAGTLAFHPAPAAPAPAPSQIRFPRLPSKTPFSGFPGSRAPKAEMVFLSQDASANTMASTGALRQEYPTTVH